MKRSEREARSTGSPHLHRIPLTGGRPQEAFAGSDIVHEVPIAHALLLLTSYRSIMAWALAAPREHPELFPAGAAQEMRELMDVAPMADELRAALEVVAELQEDAAAMSNQRITQACVRIADWAQRRGDAPVTEFRFVQAAGMCAPNDARLAYRAGTMARQRAIWELAELWFRHAISVGRRKRDPEAQALAYVGLGYGYYQQGRYAVARREQLKALRVARRHGLKEVQAKALHDLFVVAAETGESSEAEEYAHAAIRAYGPAHPIIPGFAHDIAYFWILRGQLSRALPVLRALLPHRQRPEDRLRVLASLARVAGAVQERVTFEMAWEEAWKLAPDLEGTTVLSTSYLELARGAAGIREWERAETAAARALELSRERQENDVVLGAERLLESISEDGREDVSAVPARPLNSGVPADALALELVSTLEAQAARI